MSSPNSGELQQRLAGMHPVDVAAERIDFAVVRDVAVGMRALPTGKSIRGKALVDEAQRAHDIGIGKLTVEVRRSAVRARSPL